MQSRSQETRTHILGSAGNLFSHQGYSDTSVSEICATAGISKGAFYYHFSSKQELFIALLENWLDDLDMVFTKIQEKTDNISDAILEMANIAGDVLQSPDTNISIILEFWMQAYRDPTIWEAAVYPYQRYMKYFTSLFEKGIQDGSFKSIDPEVAARVTVSLGLGLLLQALFDSKKTQWDIALRQSIGMLIETVSRSKA